MHTNAQYINDPKTAIRCDIGGVTSFVPLDPANTDYNNIMKLVQEGKLTIAPAATANTGK
jgi:hypothetical protein